MQITSSTGLATGVPFNSKTYLKLGHERSNLCFFFFFFFFFLGGGGGGIGGRNDIWLYKTPHALTYFTVAQGLFYNVYE